MSGMPRGFESKHISVQLLRGVREAPHAAQRGNRRARGQDCCVHSGRGARSVFSMMLHYQAPTGPSRGEAAGATEDARVNKL